MNDEDELLIELCREKLITDPFNFFFLSDLADQCPKKEARSLDEWEILSHYELLKKHDYKLWRQAIERENVEVELKLLNMWSSAMLETPNPEYGSELFLLAPQASKDMLKDSLEISKYDFENSQKMFFSLIDLLISSGQLDQAKDLYEKRLQVPHLQLHQTYEAFTSFISQNFPNSFSEIMKTQSRVLQETERSQRYYEKFEAQILQSPEDPEVWARYMENVFRYVKESELKLLFLNVFYRSLEYYPNKESWHIVFETAIQMGRESKLDDFQIKNMVILWRKAYPNSLKPLRALIPFVKDYDSLNTLRVSIKSGIDGTPECLETIKALISLQCLFVESSPPLLQVLWEDMQFYASKYPASLDFLRIAVTVSDKIPIAKPDDLVLKYFEENKFSGEIFISALRYFSGQSTDDTIFFHLLDHYETKATEFDHPEAVLPYFENYLISMSDVESYASIHNRLELLKGKLQSVKPKKTKREVEEDTLKESFTEVQKQKRVKEESSESEVEHRNRELYTITIKGDESGFDLITEQQIRDFFKGYGDPVSITLPADLQVLAKVELSSEQEVLTCLTRSGKKLAGQVVEIERLFGSTLWLTNYPPSYTHDKLKSLLGQQKYADVNNSPISFEPLSIRLPSQTTARERRFCYVEYARPEHATAAKSVLDNLVVDGHTLRVEISNPALKRQRTITSPKHQVYVKNLNFTKTSKEALEWAFSQFGPVNSISMPLNSHHENSLNSGYAFITFTEEASAKKAIKSKEIYLDGRVVSIFALKPREAHTRDAHSYEEQKSITILNLPLSVTSKQLSTYLEGLVGAVKRLTVHSDDHMALVEFEKVADAGKAGFLLLSAEFDGQNLTVAEKSAFFNSKKPKKVEMATKVPMMAAPMMMRRRPKK